VDEKIVLKKVPLKMGIRKWRGKCVGMFAKQGYSSVDKVMEDIRGKR